MRNTKTTKDLYDALMKKSDLHSFPVLDDKILIWQLYKDAYVRAYCDSYDTCIDIVSTSPACPSTHWHPEEGEMLDELYALGKKGNILVLKKYLTATGVFYLGDPRQYRFDKAKTRHWGKLTYLEQR